jgi:hypothetical protein
MAGVVPNGRGRAANAGGMVRRPTTTEALRILLSAGETDDALGVVEMVFAAGSAGPPLHVHPPTARGSTCWPASSPSR